ncbi:MAG: hypothetical protein CVV50_00325 [Spirochaetae bacterium HGW-Spirochaetae-6]|nr:MAG: hypothetical protein CVV50_00325 [Spirochaetae bacterium HGW-Spirochaetae-6]
MQNENKKLNKLLSNQQEQLNLLEKKLEESAQTSLFLKKNIQFDEKKWLEKKIQTSHFQEEKSLFAETFEDYEKIMTLTAEEKERLKDWAASLPLSQGTLTVLNEYESKTREWQKKHDLPENWEKLLSSAIRELTSLYAAFQKISKQDKT